ncbi:MAG: hypothetical protein R3B90_13025 [Planctomycetaceae bacterium]
MKLHTRGKLRRLRDSFSSPRRIALSITAILLASLWLSNVLLSILFREPYGQAALRIWATGDSLSMRRGI